MIPLVDDIDKDLLEYKWYIAREYWKKTNPKTGNTKEWYLHRIILTRMIGRPLKKGEMCDHINMDQLDNRRSNLRLADYSLNSANRGLSKNNTSGYKGLYFQSNRWLARIKYKQKTIYIGSFKTKEEAAIAYNKKAIEIFGEYARLNVVVPNK